MTRFRPIPVFRSIYRVQSSPHNTNIPTFTQQQRLYAGSNYGGGEGDPKGERPQEQGSNPSSDLEHPGPPPPDVGKGTGGGPTKAGAEGHNTQDNASSNGQSGSGTSGANGKPQPKIHKHDATGEQDHSEDVRAHNEDMNKRHDRAEEKSPDEDDKVDKGFWKGQGGADRDP